MNFISNISHQWFDLPDELKPRFQKLIFPQGMPYTKSDGFGTITLNLIFEINQSFCGKIPRSVDQTLPIWNQFVNELKQVYFIVKAGQP